MGWRWGAALGALGVMLGAFGAHGLKAFVDDPHRLEIWDTAARYHLVHAVAILAVAAHPRRPRAPAVLFAVGIGIFSGSLYLLALTGVTWLGAITPIGGLSLIAGWIALALSDPAQPAKADG